MAEYKVLITTSGVGSRLGNLTKYTNKSLVRVGDRPIISHIIDQYDPNVEFVITLGHHGDKVEQYLALAYPKLNVTFVEVDKYEGEGSSLAYSMQCAKAHLQCPFIFNAGDTITEDSNIGNFTKEPWIGISKSPVPNIHEYRTVNYSEGRYTKRINEKGSFQSDGVYIGLCFVRDYELFWMGIHQAVLHKESEASDVHGINFILKHSSQQSGIAVLEFPWVDTGNVTALQRAREIFPCSVSVLAKENEDIFLHDFRIIKFFADPLIVKQRVRRAELLRDCIPLMIGFTENFYAYKKVQGQEFSRVVDPISFMRFLQFLKTRLWTKAPVDLVTREGMARVFYVDKTLNRVKALQVDDALIRGKQMKSLEELLYSYCSQLNLIESVRVHGDLVLDNVIVDSEGNFTLIDWRQDFAGQTAVGDLYYDVAKLNHSLYLDHKTLIDYPPTDQPEVFVKQSRIELMQILKHFAQEELGLFWPKVEFITGLIWVNMAPLHPEMTSFLYRMGIYQMNKAYNESNFKHRNYLR